MATAQLGDQDSDTKVEGVLSRSEHFDKDDSQTVVPDEVWPKNFMKNLFCVEHVYDLHISSKYYL